MSIIRISRCLGSLEFESSIVNPTRWINRWLKIRQRFFTASLESVLVAANTLKKQDKIVFQLPSNFSPDDVSFTFSEAAYQYRSSTVGYGGIAVASLWTVWAISTGGWFVVLFKQLALPFASSYFALRCLDAHLLANGAERIQYAIQSGNAEYICDR